MTVFPECLPVILPGHTVFPQPIISLELAAGQDDVHILDCVIYAPDILNDLCTGTLQKVLEVYLMQHPLDIRHADLKRSMAMPAAVGLVHCLSVLLRNQSDAVEASDLHIFQCLYSVIFPRLIPFPNSNDGNSLYDLRRVVDHNDAVRLVNTNAVYPDSAGKQQFIVCIELTELTALQDHIHHHAPAHWLIQVCTNK